MNLRKQYLINFINKYSQSMLPDACFCCLFTFCFYTIYVIILPVNSRLRALGPYFDKLYGIPEIYN